MWAQQGVRLLGRDYVSKATRVLPKPYFEQLYRSGGPGARALVQWVVCTCLFWAVTSLLLACWLLHFLGQRCATRCIFASLNSGLRVIEFHLASGWAQFLGGRPATCKWHRASSFEPGSIGMVSYGRRSINRRRWNVVLACRLARYADVCYAVGEKAAHGGIPCSAQGKCCLDLSGRLSGWSRVCPMTAKHSHWPSSGKADGCPGSQPTPLVTSALRLSHIVRHRWVPARRGLGRAQ